MWGKLILTTVFGLAASVAIADDNASNNNIESSDKIDTMKSSEATRKKAPDRSQSVENVLLEEHALFDRTFSVELGYSYAHFDRSELILRGFLALDAIFLGELSVDEIEGRYCYHHPNLTLDCHPTPATGLTDTLSLPGDPIPLQRPGSLVTVHLGDQYRSQ